MSLEGPPLTAEETARLVGDGSLSAVAVVGEALRRAEARHADLRAFTQLWRESALEAARQVDAAISAGERLQLAGVPIGLKAPGSLNGSQARRLAAAGAVPIGITSVPTKATPWQTWGHTDRGPMTNPWRADRSPAADFASPRCDAGP